MDRNKINPELLHLIGMEEADKEQEKRERPQEPQKAPRKQKDYAMTKYIILATFAILAPFVELIVLLHIL